jgi:hypothetical protein
MDRANASTTLRAKQFCDHKTKTAPFIDGAVPEFFGETLSV